MPAHSWMPKGRLVSKNQKIPTSDAFAAVCRGEESTRPAPSRSNPRRASPSSIPASTRLMVRKQFIKGMNYFDERYGHFWADADLAMQARNAQKKIRIYPKIRSTFRPDRDPLAGDAVVKADCVLGASHFLGKHTGFMAGLGFRLSAIFRALFSLDFGQLSALVSGQKLDGNQAG